MSSDSVPEPSPAPPVNLEADESPIRPPPEQMPQLSGVNGVQQLLSPTCNMNSTSNSRKASSTLSPVPYPIAQRADEPIGMDCYADDRDALNDFAKYFNNTHLSDLQLVVGEEVFPAHRIILCRSSEVFDRMLSQKWQGDRKEIELTEEPQCQAVFPTFLRFLYCNHVVLNPVNVLPVLVLADKYNVNGLKKVCLEYAVNYILPELDPKEVFLVWFGYATKAYHVGLIDACIELLAKCFHSICTSPEWEKEWLSVDRDQMCEFLKSNRLVLPSEFVLWEAIQRWLKAPSHPERRGNTSSPLLVQLLPLVRFPYMSADELASVESSPAAMQHPKIFMAHTHLAYKFISMPLASRAVNKEFMGTQFLLRNYGEVRWEKRFTVTSEQLYERNHDHTFLITTKSNNLSLAEWNWSLNFHVTSPATHTDDQLRLTLTALDNDHTSRSIEYLLMVVSEKRVLKMLSGSKMLNKPRYTADLELRNKLDISEIFAENACLLTNGHLNLQLILRPLI